MPSKYNIPMSSPDLTDIERKAVEKVLQTPTLSMGKEIKALEGAFCDYIGSRYAIGVSSGTAGLHLCILASGIQDGDLVITTPFSFVASSNVLLYERAIPVFVDVDPLTGNIDHEQVRQAVEDISKGGKSARKWLPHKLAANKNAVKAILAVDVFGQPVDMDEIRKTSDKFELTIIEDSCEAIGSEYNGRKAGTLGDFGVFAFYPNKQITSGEGGIIVTNDERAANLMMALRNQGRNPGDTWLQHTRLGYNYRLNEMSAALGRVQLSRIEEFIEKRSRVASWYSERLECIAGVEHPQTKSSTTCMSWFVYVVRIAHSIDRDTVAQNLHKAGIPARPYFLPIHLQPYMVERFGYKEGDYPVTEDLGRRSLALPFSSVMNEKQVDQVCHVLAEVL